MTMYTHLFATQISKAIASAGLLIALALSAGCGGPMGPIAGGELSGAVHSGPVPDWNAVTATVDNAQLETNPADPYSINIWAGSLDGRLYVPTSLIMGPDDPNERTWVNNVMADPNVRIRMNEVVYELRAKRVQSPELVARVKAALMAKHAEDEDEHSEAAWVFELVARS